MTEKRRIAAEGIDKSSVPHLSRQSTAGNGIENPIDPDAPREGRLASFKTRGLQASRGTVNKIAFKPKVVQRRKKDSESLLSFDNDDEGDQGSHTARRSDRGRGRGSGRGRIRQEPSLVASGPFAQGPAHSPLAKGKAIQRLSGGESARSKAVGSRINGISGDANTETKLKASKPDIQEEANLDDSGRPMKNLSRMRDTSDHWAPITTERIERSAAPAQVAVAFQGPQDTKLSKLKNKNDDLSFIDVKTELTESTLTSRVPSPEAVSKATNAQDVAMENADEDDEDIPLPHLSPKKPRKEVKSKDESKGAIKVMTAEEAEEEDRLAADLAFLRMTLGSGDNHVEVDEDQIYFIQLPEILPYWKPGPEEDRDEIFVKEEAKAEVIEIDQKAEDEKASDRKGRQLEHGTQDTRDNKSDAAPENTRQQDDESGNAENKSGVPEKDIADKADAPKKRRKKQKPVQFPPPEGLLGQLHIHRSGKISCTWGGIEMEVGRGSDCGFLQDIMAVDAKQEKKAWVLGRVTNRLMLIPNLDKLLNDPH